MSAAEDDTELRDLLIQNLENSGVLNKLKAEMRAAVFLAMEEQDRLENKTPLVNENLKKCLNSKDGRLVAGLIVDFLQVFNLDFSLSVFQPEINSLNGLDSRDSVCRDLCLSESELNRKSPLLLELVRRGRHRDQSAVSQCEQETRGNIPKEPSQKQISAARKTFDVHDKNKSGSVLKDDLKSVFTDLFPSLNKNMLERFVADELKAADKSFSKTVDFQLFLGIYRRLFTQCRSVVVQESDDVTPSRTEERVGSPPVSKDSECVLGKGDVRRGESSSLKKDRLDLDLEAGDEPEEGDSFFDDPLPKPQKTYGWKMETSGARESPAGSLSEGRGGGGSEGGRGAGAGSEGGRGAGAGSEGGRGGGGSISTSDLSHSRNASNSREKGFKDSKTLNEKTGSLHLDDDVEYDDDFNSHRSDLSRSELSIGEEIEEVSIEGPDHSDKFDESTQDLSVSQLSHSHADYMEEVS
ncbi:FGFR1 oncogene partner [Scomber japonicus]|uniref:FGFR1 oncogene partner n=1 Tax=Scomber japonicus TaxID=13676 RepID=UPI0023068D5A|nr:FGFR1 oncogene partner [Scomber japonicus]